LFEKEINPDFSKLVAVGTPNQINNHPPDHGLGSNVQAMCKDRRVNEAFNEDPETCSSEGKFKRGERKEDAYVEQALSEE